MHLHIQVWTFTHSFFHHCAFYCNSYTSSKAKFPSSTSTVYCGFPTNNTTFRLVIGVFGFVTVLILFFHTPLSFVARPIFATYAFLFFAVAVLDINATATGESACLSNFGDTSLKAVIDYSGITLVCSQGRFAALCIFDLIISALFFLVYSAWLFCNDRYVRKGLTNDQKSLLASPSTRKAVPTTEV